MSSERFEICELHDELANYFDNALSQLGIPVTRSGRRDPKAMAIIARHFDTVVTQTIRARDAEWGALLVRITNGNQSSEAPFPCPDEAAIREYFDNRVIHEVTEAIARDDAENQADHEALIQYWREQVKQAVLTRDAAWNEWLYERNTPQPEPPSKPCI